MFGLIFSMLMTIKYQFVFCFQVVDEIWVCENQTVTKYDGDIFKYKKQLTKEVKSTISQQLVK